MTNALAITAAGMIFVNPLILRFDVGFQLSFLALVGIVYLSPILNRIFSFLPDLFKEGFVATIAAQIFTLPILIFNFDQLSLIAPLTNVLVLWLVPYTMLLGFVTGVLGFIWLPFANLLSWPTWMFLSYIISIVEWTAKIPFSNLATHFDAWAVIAYYVVIISFLVLWTVKRFVAKYNPKVLYKPEVSG
jgi:competence protein ComEC